MSSVFLITLLTFVIHIPFGYMRSRSRKYSLQWWVYIHIPIPFIAAVRILTHTDYKFIPMFVIAAIAGQYVGGKIPYQANKNNP